MEILIKLAEQSPMGVALIIVITIFMKYIEKRDLAMDTIHKETLSGIKENSSAMGKMTEAIRKCEKSEVKN